LLLFPVPIRGSILAFFFPFESQDPTSASLSDQASCSSQLFSSSAPLPQPAAPILFPSPRQQASRALLSVFLQSTSKKRAAAISFLFPQSSQSACSPVVSLLSFPKQPPTPSLNFVYRKNQQLDPNSFSKNIKSASSSISMISCVGPWCASDHQQFLLSSNQSTQISKLAASF
jgi:hypothetical protein